MNRTTLVGVLGLMACASALRAAEPTLTVKQDDVWVMAGDSITAGRKHTNFIEAFYRTRYPNLNLHFHNSGVRGNDTGGVLNRFDYDVAAWKPTIISIELGMNDTKFGDDPARYVKGMRQLIGKIREIHAQPVLISSSPMNDGSVMGDWKSDHCRSLDTYTVALKKLAEEEKVVMVDQYHPLVDLWGKNMRSAKPLLLGGDLIHPGSVGQYNMAAVILAGLNVDRDVSAATLKADGTVVDARRCKISAISVANGKLAFTRLDDAGPWPIDPKCRTALELLPSMADLSQYLLTIPDLPVGRYRITINDKPAAVLTAAELAAGWNMATVFEGALAERSAQILGLIEILQGDLNKEWRDASRKKDAARLAAAQKAIEACEKQVHAACQPVPLRFEVEKEK